jgi:glyoxylase-like metal-dependent hydrolase (beta-lactamase superfamily II)
MKSTSHGEYLTKISKGGFVNCFLVREDDGFTLIDTMLPKSEKGILEASRSLGAPIVRIALTHAHQDHVGSVDALKAALPDAEVLITARDARFLTGDKSLEPDEAVNGKPRGSWMKLETQPTRLINPGERIGSLEVIASPGHTPGHVAFLDTRDRTLIAGDSWVTLGGVSVPSRANPRFPLVWFGTGNRPQALESAKALRALDPSRLAVGHGKVVESPGAAMDRAIAKAS